MKVERFTDILRQYGDISSEASEMMFESMNKVAVYNRDHIIHAGEITKKMYFIESHCVRFYRINEDGKEITINFSIGPAFFTAFQSFYSQTDAEYFVQAMQNMECYTLSSEALYNLYARWESIRKISDVLHRKVFIDLNQRLQLLLYANPVQKYHWLLNSFPNLINEVPLYYIASFLGMSPETLSRVRTAVSNNS